MKKILLIMVISLLSSMSSAQERDNSYVYKCMQALQHVMQENVYEIPGRTTMVAMFNENFNGMYAREEESKADEGVISSGALLIERKGLHVCRLDWSYINPKPVVFKIKDSAGKLKLRFEFGKKNLSGEIEAFEQASYFTSVSQEANGKSCNPVSDVEKQRARDLLKKIILAGLRKHIAAQVAKGAMDIQTPVYCSNIVGITSENIENLKPTRAPAVLPATDPVGL